MRPTHPGLSMRRRLWYNVPEGPSNIAEDTMPTLQITLSEPQQQFVMGRVAELGLERPDQYIEKLLEEEQRQKLDEYYMEKVQEAIDADRWTSVPEDKWPEFWDRVRQKAKQLRDARVSETAK